MKTPIPRLSGKSLASAALIVLGAAVGHADYTLTLQTTPINDAGYAWNSKYGPYGYTTGGMDLGVGLYLGAPYGNDYTVGIIEIPIGDLTGGTLSSASLNVYSNGFGTGYYYGSAALYWIAPTMTLTGDPEADGVGSLLSGVTNEYTVWDSTNNQPAGWFSFDVTAHVQQDLDAGRTFSTFVLGGSRDTSGSIRAAEYGPAYAPQITAVSSVPEPTSFVALASGVALLGLLRWRRSSRSR